LAMAYIRLPHLINPSTHKEGLGQLFSQLFMITSEPVVF
jgi:hypothetical protein